MDTAQLGALEAFRKVVMDDMEGAARILAQLADREYGADMVWMIGEWADTLRMLADQD